MELFRTISLSSFSDRSVIGSCFVEVDDPPEIIEAKQRRLQIGSLLNKIRSLSFEEFEVFGSKVLRELGASVIRVTPRANDQGIDFYGVLSVGEASEIPRGLSRLAHDLTLRFAGQAKHYPTRTVEPNAIRELIGSISLARFKVYTRDSEILMT